MIKIAITGVESTGKTSLAQALAQRLGCAWVSEQARDYLQQLQRPYNLLDVENIARAQLQAEQQAPKSDFLICDTEPLVCKIWAEWKFGQCGEFIQSAWEAGGYDFYLLAAPTEDWEADPLRETPNFADRMQLFYLYKQHLARLGRKFLLVSGSTEARLGQVLAFLGIEGKKEA